MCYGWFLDSALASEKVWLNQALFIVFVEEDVELEPTIHSAQCLFSCSPKHLYSGGLWVGVTYRLVCACVRQIVGIVVLS